MYFIKIAPLSCYLGKVFNCVSVILQKSSTAFSFIFLIIVNSWWFISGHLKITLTCKLSPTLLKLRATDKEVSIFFSLSKYFHAKYYLTTTSWFWWHIQVMEILLYSLLVWFQVLKQYMWWAVSGQPFTSLKNIAPAFCSDVPHSCIQISGPSLPPHHRLGRRLGTVYSSLFLYSI